MIGEESQIKFENYDDINCLYEFKYIFTPMLWHVQNRIGNFCIYKKVDSEVSLRNWHLVSRYWRDEVRLHRIDRRWRCDAVKMGTW